MTTVQVLNGVDATFLSDDKKHLLKENVLHKFTEVEKQYNVCNLWNFAKILLLYADQEGYLNDQTNHFTTMSTAVESVEFHNFINMHLW